MTGSALSRRLRLTGIAISLSAASMLAAVPADARGPDGIADIAEKVIDSVVNISTSQSVEAKGGGRGREAMPQLPPGSPFEEFFDDFFKNRRGGAPKVVAHNGCGDGRVQRFRVAKPRDGHAARHVRGDGRGYSASFASDHDDGIAQRWK